MSTKQSLLYTLMIFFLITMLVAIGYWFSSSMDLKKKKDLITAQQNVYKALTRQWEGSGDTKGLRDELDDPLEGLKKKAADLANSVPLLKSNSDQSAPGMDELEAKYKELDAPVREEWTKKVVEALNASKDDRVKMDGDLVSALKRLQDQLKEKDEKETAAGKDLETEEQNREVELKKIDVETAKMTQDLENVRFEQEVTQQKVAEVSRDLSKVKSVVPQGRIVQADARTMIAYIDLGTRQGVRKGMVFEVYSGKHRQLVKKCLLEITDPGDFSSKGTLMASLRDSRWDPISGWIPDSPSYLYSKFAAGGPDETEAVELIPRKTVKDKVEELRIDTIAKQEGQEAADAARTGTADSSVPPSDVNLTNSPVEPGDWVFNADFVPLVAESDFHAQLRDELKTLRDVNVGPLTFYISDTVKPYRKEYIKRLCEHNGCKVADVMNPNVNIVVTGLGFTDLELITERTTSLKGKDNLKEDEKALLATQGALADARKYSASVIAEADVEGFFERRQRKQQLIDGKVIQPGRSSFFIAGKMKQRSPELLARYIEDHGGIVAKDIEAKVDYVVVGEAPDDTFVEKIKKLGLKIVREDEIPELLGVTK